jgi:hypothetical protein
MGREGFPEIRIPLQPLQIGPKLGGGLAGNVAILLQRFIDDPFEFGRHVRIQPHRRYGSAFQNGVEDQPRSVASKRQCARAHLVQHRSEREQVRARVEILTSNL